MFKKLSYALGVLIFGLSFLFVGKAFSALETQLVADTSPNSDNVAYLQTQWYGFTATGGKGYSVTLAPTSGNANLYLFDTSFSLVGYSANTGTTADKVWYGQSSSGPMHIAAYGLYNLSSNFTIQLTTAPYVKTITPTSGGAGTLVTLTGYGFGSARGTSYVQFGTIQAINYSSWTNTEIKVYVPSGCGNGVL